MEAIHNAGWHRHRMLCNPMEDLLTFMSDCSPDPVTRVMSTTALVLALCQAAGPSMMIQPPGFLLINAGGAQEDPIDGLMQQINNGDRPRPGPKPEDYERNRNTMRASFLTKPAHARLQEDLLFSQGLQPTHPCPYAQSFYRAMGANHKGGRAGWYADRYDKDFGWFTDSTKHTILRLDRDEDRAQFYEDLRSNMGRLLSPVGYNEQMRAEKKLLSVAGSIPVAEWERLITRRIVENAMPVLILPHTASEPLKTPADQGIEWIGMVMASEAQRCRSNPVQPQHSLARVMNKRISQRVRWLHLRLANFPVDYAYFIMQTLREMLHCCERLAGILVPDNTPHDASAQYALHLFTYVIEGFCLSVDALAWHEYFFPFITHRAETNKVLTALRKRGPMSKRDLLRHQQWLTKEVRDKILEHLVHEHLIRMERNHITPVAFADYWQHVIRRSFVKLPELPFPQAQQESIA